MTLHQIHSWSVSIQEARAIQERLSQKIETACPCRHLSEIKIIAGCDVSYSPKEDWALGVAVALSFPELKVLEVSRALEDSSRLFPYIPGLLSFREAPPILSAISKLKAEPDVFLFDGQGIAHPRGLGLAAHLGFFLERPTIGCAKSRLYGEAEEPPPGLKGAYTFLKDGSGEVIGAVLRSRVGCLPLYISAGYKMGLPFALDIVMATLTRYRLPEPLRVAHNETMKKGR